MGIEATSSEHGGRGRRPRTYRTHMLGAVFPLTAGVALYGWRAAGVVAIVVGCAVLATMAWKQIGRRGAVLRIPQAIWLGLLLALMLPAHALSSGHRLGTESLWPLLPAAGLLLVMALWVVAGSRFSYTHPVILAYLGLVVLFGGDLRPRVVLERGRAVWGEVLHFGSTPASPREEPWVYQRDENTGPDAILWQPTATTELSNYTRGLQPHGAGWRSIEVLLRDDLPPLEDLAVGGHPGPIGASSVIAVVVGGLFLIYRKLIDYRVPLLTVIAAYVALLLLPVPVAIDENGIAQWLPIVLPRGHLDWAVVLTFANYELMASPLIWTAFFLATSAYVCPSPRKARVAYALLLGVMAAAAQLYLSCSLGPYVALLIAGLLTPWLEARFEG